MLELLATTFMAGLLYVFIPGPATLAALSLSAGQGRREGEKGMKGKRRGEMEWKIIEISERMGGEKEGKGRERKEKGLGTEKTGI